MAGKSIVIACQWLQYKWFSMASTPTVIACQWLQNKWLSMVVNGWVTFVKCIRIDCSGLHLSTSLA
jgi:hypothetical protein